MKIRSIKSIKNLKNRRVLLRVDFNVSIGNDLLVDKNEDYRLVQTLPTIKYLMKKGAKVIIMAHLGRPDGRVVEDLRLDPVAVRLSQLLEKEIFKSDDILGKEVENIIKEMNSGDILMLENIRFHPREEKGCKKFAKQLSKLGDLYVNEAFATSHRNHSSISTIQDYLPSYAGFLLENEILTLNKVLNNPKKPLITIIGGAKISTKIKVIKNLLKSSEKILLGGAIANTVLNAMGISVGKSPIELKMFDEIKKINLTENKLVVPVDGVMARSFNSTKGRKDALGDVHKNELVLDVGIDTIKLYGKIIKTAKMVVWNGPMGLIENPVFSKGTEELIRILAKSNSETIIGGGETVTMIRKMKLEDKFSFISTGGGAMLEFLEGKKLPGIKKLLK